MTDPVDEDALADAYNAALDFEKAGERTEAIAAWREVLALDPRDPGGAAIRLAALGAAPAPMKASPAYVATLFDQHAEVFDGILVDQLEYGVPFLLRERLEALRLGPFQRMLDLGCGTGLAAEALEDRVTHFTGVDLAEGMIEIAGEKDLYDHLFVGDVAQFLHETTEQWDLIVATDVLPYLGDVDALMQAIASRLTLGGHFAFSTETLPAQAFDSENGGSGWRITPQHRFAHDTPYIEGRLAAASFKTVECSEIMVRRENGAPIPGHLVVARLTAAR